MNRNIMETVMGALVLLVAVGFLVFAYNSSNTRPVDGYSVTADFKSVAGLTQGSDVRIGGVKVGVVESLLFDFNKYKAIVQLRLKSDAKIPTDSTAAVVSDGLLGSKYIGIEPGAEEKMFADGGRFNFTQDSVSIEQLIGKFMFSGGGVDDDKSKKPDAASTPTSNDMGM